MATEPCFPDEIIVEILLKLPVKSILRFNTLSKNYCSLIRNKFFIRQHLALAHGRGLNDKLNDDKSIVSPIQGSIRLFNNQSGYFENLKSPPPLRLMSTGRFNLDYLISGPVDGLYCFINPMCDNFAVWNPSTRETFILPSLSDAYNKHIARFYFKACLYFRRCVALGFGYDDTTDDYKVVLIHKFNINKLVYLFTFSVSKGEWRKTEENFSLETFNIKSYIGVFVRGACHWLNAPSCNSAANSILAFDLSTELHRIIAFPDTLGEEHAWSDGFCIVTVNGFLGLVNPERVDYTHHWKGMSPSFDVWVMDEYSVTESWKILYRLSLEPGIVGRFWGIVRNRVYVGEYDRHLVSHDLNSKDQKRYSNILERNNHSLDYFVPYEESLVRIIK